jgi:hypothetical protein
MTFLERMIKIQKLHLLCKILVGSTYLFKATPRRGSFARVLSSYTVSIKHINKLEYN